MTRPRTSLSRFAGPLILIAGLAMIAAASLLMPGCATGKGADGSTVVGFQTNATPEELDRGAASGSATGELIGGLFGQGGAGIGSTIGNVVGFALAAIGGGIVVKRQRDARADARVETARTAGLDAGWDERDAWQRELDRAYDDGARDAAKLATPVANAGPGAAAGPDRAGAPARGQPARDG